MGLSQKHPSIDFATYKQPDHVLEKVHERLWQNRGKTDLDFALQVYQSSAYQLINELLRKELRYDIFLEQVKKLEDEFEIAKQPTTTVMTSNNHRTVNILNQLGSYEFDPETIARTLEEKFTKEVFQIRVGRPSGSSTRSPKNSKRTQDSSRRTVC